MSSTRVGATIIWAIIMAACQRPSPRPEQGTAAAPPPETTAARPIPAGGPDTSTPAPTRDTATRPAPKRDTVTAAVKPPVRRPPPRKDTVKTPASDTTPPQPLRDSARVEPPTVVADQPLRDAYHTAPLDTVDAKVYQGWKYYNLNCSRCHGEDVQGTTIAPHLILSLKPDGTIPDEPTFLTTVCGGRVEKGMPAWCTLGMTPAQIDTIYSYVKGRSDAKLHPGRPARRTE